MRLAILWRRIGPYHRARLEAAGKLGDLWCIEGGGADRVYAWDKVTEAKCFRRVTLFPDADPGDMPARGLQRRVCKALDEVQPSVVAVPGWDEKLAYAALRWTIAAEVPAVVLTESNEFDAKRTWLKESIKKRLVRSFAAGLAGGATALAYLRRLGLDETRIFSGYDVVDNEYFAHSADRVRSSVQDVIQRYSLPRHYLLASGRFIEKKNFFRLIDAYARYRELGRTSQGGRRLCDTWELVVLGDGPMCEQIHRRTRELSLLEVVHFPGFKQYQDLPAYYGLASAFVHPSTVEQWGLVVNEAMASGLPVLVSNRCGCAPDLVREGVNGFTFDPLNVEQLAQLMFRLWTMEPEQLRRMGEASREIISHWSPELFAQNLWKAAETALAAPRLRPTVLDRLLLWSLLYLR